MTYEKPEEESNTLPTDEDYFGYSKKVNEYKEIVLRAIEECRVQESKQMSVEMVGTRQGASTRIETVNQPQIFCQCVDALDDLMLRYYDDDIKESIKKIQDELEKTRQKYMEVARNQEVKIKEKEVSKALDTFPITPVGKFYEEKFNNFIFLSQRKKYRELLLLFARRNDLSRTRIVF